MMHKYLKTHIRILAIFCFITIATYGQNNSNIRTKLFNIGIKAGFNSTNFQVEKIEIGNFAVEKIKNDYHIGYFGTLFTRLNIKKHYIQPELTYNVSKGKMMFDKWNNDITYIDQVFSKAETEIHSIDIPILYGYNTIKEDNYGLSVFAGPKVKFIITDKSKTTFENFTIENLTEEFNKMSATIVLGASVNIHNVFFDIRYEHGLSDISEKTYSTVDKKYLLGAEKTFRINRGLNAISFSIGTIF